MLAKQAFGNGSNKGPSQIITTSIISELNREPKLLFPPVLSKTLLRDRDAAEGKQLKNEPKTLEAPVA
jgi:hypothetical protein